MYDKEEIMYCIDCTKKVILEGVDCDGYKCFSCGAPTHDECGVDEFCFECS